MTDEEGASDEEQQWCDEDLTDDEWRQFVAYLWSDSLNDPREDIYTLEDGQPVYHNGGHDARSAKKIRGDDR